MKSPVRVSPIASTLNVHVLNKFCAIDCRSDDGKLQRKCAATRVFDVKTDAQTSQCEMEVLGDYQGKVFIGGAGIRMGNLPVIR